MIAAGKAIQILTRNLSLSSTFKLRVAAMVVSEIIDKLSPNMAPLTTAPIVKMAVKSVACEKPKAIGAQAAIVPIDVPIAVAINAEMINSIGKTKVGGIMDKPN